MEVYLVCRARGRGCSLDSRTTETAFREGKLKDARLHLDGLSAIWRETRVLLADLATLEQG
jgi:predicted alpha/beta-fold hydrolase